MKEEKEAMLSADISASLISAEQYHFWCMTILHIAHLSRHCRRELFELSYFLEKRGLSDSGRHFLSRLGLAVGNGKFSTLQARLEDQATEKLRYDLFHTLYI